MFQSRTKHTGCVHPHAKLFGSMFSPAAKLNGHPAVILVTCGAGYFFCSFVSALPKRFARSSFR